MRILIDSPRTLDLQLDVHIHICIARFATVETRLVTRTFALTILILIIVNVTYIFDTISEANEWLINWAQTFATDR